MRGISLQRVLGAEIDRDLLPVLAVTFVSQLALSAHFIFQGIYAIRELGASPGTFAWALLAEAALTMFAGYLGGHLSDRYGRRRVMLLSWSGQAAALVALASASGLWTGLGLIVLAGLLGGPGRAAAAALIADLVPQERQEAGYAAQRVAENLAVVTGPPAGGLVLLSGSWPALFVGAAALVAVAVAMGARLLPERPPHAPDRRGADGERPLALIRRDHAFMLFMVASTLASLAFIASETVLPIAAVTLYGLSPSTWGLIAGLNPLAVVLFQMRITRWTQFVPVVHKLTAAMALMGCAAAAASAGSRAAADRSGDPDPRDRRDAVGAELAGHRRPAGARRGARRLHGSGVERRRRGLRAGPADRPSAAGAGGRHRDVGVLCRVLRRRRGGRRLGRGSGGATAGPAPHPPPARCAHRSSSAGGSSGGRR